jgi:hypothetical protein
MNEEIKPGEVFVPTDFKLGKKEKVGEHEAQAVEYTFKPPFGEMPSVVVWIDLKTQLPLKRAVTEKTGNQKRTYIETFTKLNLDGKIDPKQFELPKK